MKISLIKLSFLSIYFFLGVNLCAQNLIYQYYSPDEDLPFLKIYSSIIDSEGLLFLGTEKGLFSFDGIEFKEIPIPIEDEILNLEKNDNKVYAIGISNSIYLIENRKAKLLRSGKNSFNSYIRVVKQGNNMLLSQNHNYIERLNLTTFKIDSLYLKGLPKSAEVIASNPLYIYQNRLYVYLNIKTHSGIYAFDLPHLESYKKIIETDDIDGYSFVEFNDKLLLCSTNENRIQEVTPNGLNPSSYKYGISTSKRRFRFSKHKSKLLLMSNKGLEIYNNNFKLEKEILPQYTVTGCTKSNNSLWLSTLSNGLFYFPNYTGTIVQPSKQRTEHNNTLNKIYYFDENVFTTSTFAELHHLQNDSLIELVPNISNTETNFPLKRKVKSDSLIYSTEKMDFTFKNSSRKLKVIPSVKNVVGNKDRSTFNGVRIGSSNSNAFISVDSLQISFLKTITPNAFKKQIKYHPENKTFSVVISDLRSNRNLFIEDSSIWILTKNQLISITRNGIDTMNYNGSPIKALGLKLADDNTIWYNSKNQLFSYKTGQKLNFTTPNNEVIVDFLQTENHITICTEKSVYSIDHSGTVLNHFTTADGLPNYRFRSALVTDSAVYVTSKGGLAIIPTQELKEIPEKLMVWFSKIKFNEQLIQLDSANEINLNYNQNSLEFSIGGLALYSQKNRTYFYKLEGVDEQWISSKTAENIRYPNLPSGNFKLSIYLENSKGKKSEIDSFAFTIALPFWKTWWFITFVILSIVGVLYLIVSLRIQRLQKEKELSNRLIQSEIDGLKSQMNPHFIFNSLNSIQNLIISEDIPNSNLYLGKFARLLRMVLDFSSLQKIALEDEVTLLKTYLELESLRFKNQLTTTIQIDDSGIRNFQIPPLVLQPFVENSIKHGLLHSSKKDKTLTIKFFTKNNYVYCTIEDNGVGRAVSNEINKRREKYHNSFASEAIEKRIDLINATQHKKIEIEIKDLENGTCVEVRFPLK